MRHRPIRILALLASLALCVVAAAPASQAQKRKPLRYVALGDSYSAASGVLPLDPEASPSCARSVRNYPNVIAERTGARLTDVTCGGAATQDYFRPQYDDVPPQLEAVTRRARLITMTIGGNDGGVFVDTITDCSRAAATTAGTGHPCKAEHGREYVRKIRKNTYPGIVKALRAVHRKAPRARVAILGYPWIIPRREGCYPQMPVARGDVPYLRDVQRTLNSVVRRAARKTGTIYVNLNKASDGHDACKPIGTRWVEPVVGGTNPVIVHPNALGERKLARQAMKRLGLR